MADLPDNVKVNVRLVFDDLEVAAPQIRIIAELLAERKRQVEHGYTAEHDDEHGNWRLGKAAFERLGLARMDDSPSHLRKQFVEAAAMLIAAIEVIDRADAASIVSVEEPSA